jgi:predicted metal-dependent hydrolase
MGNKIKNYLKRILRRRKRKEQKRRRRKLLQKRHKKNDAVPKENEKKGRGWCKFLKRIFRK